MVVVVVVVDKSIHCPPKHHHDDDLRSPSSVVVVVLLLSLAGKAWDCSSDCSSLLTLIVRMSGDVRGSNRNSVIHKTLMRDSGLNVRG